MRSFTLIIVLFLTVPTLVLSLQSEEYVKLIKERLQEKSKDDYYSSMYGVQHLAKSEQKLVAKLIRYKNKLSDTLGLINEYLDDYSNSIHSLIKRSRQLRKKFKNEKYPIFKTNEDLEILSQETTANPLMVFKLLRRFAVDMASLQHDIDSGYHSKFLKFWNNFSVNTNFPTLDDLTGAADGLLRLQETYQLRTSDMANGMILEKKTDCKLLASDLQFIGIRAMGSERLATGMEWMYNAYQNVLRRDDSMLLDIIKGYLLMARTWHNDEFLKFSDTAPSNLFSNLVNSNFTNIPGLFIPPAVTEYPLEGTKVTVGLHDSSNFDALCRGEQLLSPKDTKNLRCWYSHDINPYNVLSPLKFELHHENPPVFQVYDLISDKAIDHLKNLSIKRLERARVVGTQTSGVRSDVRTSSVAWLVDRNTNNTILKQIPRLVNRATGLVSWNSKSAEDLQIQCYGSVGGYYIPHYDGLIAPGVEKSDERRMDLKRGDRVATIMFYLSDVELGGGTAFPRMGIATKAVKGSAVIWYNLKFNGKKDPLTIHGGCPVLYGNKWVANKWIRLHEQFHVRKCSTNELE